MPIYQELQLGDTGCKRQCQSHNEFDMHNLVGDIKYGATHHHRENASGRDQYIAKCRKEGIKMGRPSTYRKSDDTMREQYKKEISLLKQGMSLRNISIITGTSIMTIRKLYKFAQ